MRELIVDYGQASILINNLCYSLESLTNELSNIKSTISEIDALNIRYSKTNIILNALYEQKRKAKQTNE